MKAEQIGALCQEAGGVAGHDYPNLEAEQDAVCRFIRERVLATRLHS